MELSSEQRKRVAWLIDGHLADDYDESTFEARWEAVFAAFSSPEELFLFVSASHPAQSPAEWRRVLDHPLCDQGTAQLVFWRNSPIHLYGDEPAEECDRERYEMVREIAERCAAGGYPYARVSFDPAAFKRINFLAAHTPEELERVPSHMLIPGPGEPVPPLAPSDFQWNPGEISIMTTP